ncbi:MAG: restriction endonuclease [Calditrichaeota bacterium]|jgi:hypothetical protein|nr:restriction endonuclease [Calditrichota bacterium]
MSISLADSISGVAYKRLKAVEIDPATSHQHEFNGVEPLKQIMGDNPNPTTFPARFVYLENSDDENISIDSEVTWYDARRDHPTRSEFRLYFKKNDALGAARVGDSIFFCRVKNSEQLIIIITPESSTSEQQLSFLFDAGHISEQAHFTGKEFNSRILGPIERIILDQLEIEPEETDGSLKNAVIGEYGNMWPTGREFSAFVRSWLSHVEPRDDPDDALIMWWDTETRMFKVLEQYNLEHTISEGFKSVDDFFTTAKSAMNRRYSRAGLALEHHIEEVLNQHSLKFERNGRTEHKKQPDFLFPGSEYYNSGDFPSSGLTILGVKTSCKDRWRQVLSEGSKVPHKHLLTLEPSISENQTDEMKNSLLQLVVPSSIHKTYTENQRNWLFSVSDFIAHVREKQVSHRAK